MNDRQLQPETQISESESRYRGLYAAMSEGVALHKMVYDQAGQAIDYVIFDINPAFTSITYQGRPARLVLLRDITRRKRAEQGRLATVTELGQLIKIREGREDKILELKDEINGLKRRLGEQ
jgi:hypothetical protein